MLVTEINYSQAIREVECAKTELVVDVETTGLDPWHGHRICGIAISCPGGEFYFPFRHNIGTNLPIGWMGRMREVLSRPDCTYIGYNYKFDMMMLHQEGIKLPQRIQDPMLAISLLNENEESMALKNLAVKYLSPQAAQADEKLQALLASRGLDKGGIWRLRPDEVEEYACDDVRLTRQLRDFVLTPLKKWGLLDIWREYNDYQIALTQMEIDGMLIDVPECERLREEAIAQQEKARLQLQSLSGKSDLNPGSHPQMSKLLGMPSTSKDALTRAESKVTGDTKILMHTLQRYRGWERAHANYYGPFLEFVDDHGFLHANINMVKNPDKGQKGGTVTGRLSVNRPPLQAIPRHGDDDWVKQETQYGVKNVFIAGEDHDLVIFDYSQAELRLLCHYTKDTAMVQALLGDEDLHGLTAALVKIDRDSAKRINYGSVYGIGGRKLSGELDISQREAGSILARFHTAYPGIRNFNQRAQATAQSKRYVRLWTGRVRHYNVPEAYTHKAMSNIIQGGVAEIVRIAITNIHKDFRDTSVIQSMQVHDSIIFRIPKTMKGEVIPHIKWRMEDFQFLVPPKVDVMTGPSWGTAKKWETSAPIISSLA